MVPERESMPQRQQPWNGDERRHAPSPNSDPNGISAEDAQRVIAHHVNANRAHFDQKLDELEKSLTRVIASAFPNDDPAAHRRAHEQQIKTADWWEKAKTEIILNTAKSGIWLALLWFAYIAWEHFKEAVRK